MSSHILLDPFNIDNGELGRIAPEKAFTLGVEWATLRLLIDADPYSRIDLDIHKENVDRIKSLCNARGREVIDIMPVDDTWTSMSVMPRERNVLRLVDSVG